MQFFSQINATNLHERQENMTDVCEKYDAHVQLYSATQWRRQTGWVGCAHTPCQENT